MLDYIACGVGLRPWGAADDKPGGGAEDHEVGAQLGAHFARGCSVVLGCARSCSSLTWVGRDKPQAGGVVVAILTSEGSQVEACCAHPGLTGSYHFPRFHVTVKLPPPLPSGDVFATALP